MHLLALSQDNWIGLFLGLAVFISTLYQRMAEWAAKKERKDLTKKVESVQNDLQANTEVTKKVERQVNGATLVQLKAIADLSSRLARETGNPADTGFAEAAKKTLAAHEQAILDAEAKNKETP